MARKKEPDFTEAERNAPLMRCLDCIHWRSRGELDRTEYLDICTGRCDKGGLQCPPMHSCKGWENERGDTTEKPIDKPSWYL